MNDPKDPQAASEPPSVPPSPVRHVSQVATPAAAAATDAQPAQPPDSTIQQEVRFAVVLYGGVSLAIYINGVAQEMLRLIRATSPNATNLDEIEKIYRTLGQAIAPGVVPTARPAPNAPVRTRFSIDVISGTSAGGINGIFLAKALANNTPLTALEKLWVEQGALELLLNDSKSQTDLPFARTAGTRSLLNSRRMYWELLQAFKGMDPKPSSQRSKPLVDRISLFATTTDIRGVALPIQLSDEVVFERRYRNVFRLRFVPEGGFEKERNDFGEACNPFLAFASRCTSSFPFAFEPMCLADIDPVLKADPDYKDRLKVCGANAPSLQKFFQQYLTSTSDASTNEAFSGRAFGDGGYLNNKPFSYAIDALVETESDLPVDRKLIYVEPSPEHPELEPKETAPPNAIENSLDALITIPGYQTIREDLARALERNALISRVSEAIRQIETDSPPAGRRAMDADSLAPEISFQRDNPYVAQYYRLRVTDVTNQLATVIARAYSLEEGSATYKCLRAVLHVWRVGVYETEGGPKDRFDFLKDFDLPYRLRRLRFLIRKLDILAGQGQKDVVTRKSYRQTLRFLSEDAVPEEGAAKLGEARPALVNAYRTLLSLRRALLDDDLPPNGAVDDGAAPQNQDPSPLDIIRDVLGTRQEVHDFLDSLLPVLNAASGGMRETRRVARRAQDPADVDALILQRVQEKLSGTVGRDVLDKLHVLGVQLASLLAAVLNGPAVAPALTVLAGSARLLLPFFLNFDLFDSTIFPMLYGTPVGASVPVEIVRLSPEDVSALEPDPKARRTKLKGLAVAHFGAFLDGKWRENDILWGRLDAAERLICTLLPLEDSCALRTQLIDEAQKAILDDFGALDRIRQMALERVSGKAPNVQLDKKTARKIVTALTQVPAGGALRDRNTAIMRHWCTVLPDEMERKLLLEDVARGSQITGELLENAAAGKAVPPAGKWLAMGGRILWGMVELAAPRAAWKVAFRYWAQILYVIAILLIGGGVLSAAAQLTQFGWSLLGFTFAAQVLNLLLNSYMNGRSSLVALKQASAFLFIGAALLLIALGVQHTWWLTDKVIAWANCQTLIPQIPHLVPAAVNILFAFALPLAGLLLWGGRQLFRAIRRLSVR
jgi:patatin-related protein